MPNYSIRRRREDAVDRFAESSAEYTQKMQESKQSLQEKLKLAKDRLKEIEKEITLAEKLKGLKEQILDLEDEQLIVAKEVEVYSRALQSAEETIARQAFDQLSTQEKIKYIEEEKNKIEKERLLLSKQQEELQKAIQESATIGNVEQTKALQEQLELIEEQNDELDERLQKLQNAPSFSEQTKESLIKGQGNLSGTKDVIIEQGIQKAFGNSKLTSKLSSPTVAAIQAAASLINGTLGALNKKITVDGVDKVKNIYEQYLGKINARLQGTNENLIGIMDDVKKTVGSNAYVKQETLITNITKLVEEGISYNLEQRGFLQTISEKIAPTFSALDAHLTRLIRLQQADLTQSQLGSEAQLTQFLNSVFQDTSYLNTVYDNVASSLVDASSQFDYNQATSYNYNIQKWLGSMYSTGISEQAIGLIAQGLGYLTTGNVSALTSNSSLNTLFGLAAQRGNLSYSSILSQGLGADSANNLLKAMVELLQDIVTNTSDQVTKSAWSNITGLTLADFRAIANLTAQDIATIYESTLDYASALDTASNQMQMISSIDRTYISERIDNVIDNMFFGIGQDIASSEWQYALWKIADWGKELTGSAFGGVISAAINVAQSLSQIDDLAAGVWSLVTGTLGFGGLPNFHWSKETARGNIGGIAGYVTPGTSPLSTISGQSYSDIINLNSTDMEAANIQWFGNRPTATSITGSGGVQRSISDLYYKLFESKQAVHVYLVDISDAAAAKFADSTYIGTTQLQQTQTSQENRIQSLEDIFATGFEDGFFDKMTSSNNKAPGGGGRGGSNAPSVSMF